MFWLDEFCFGSTTYLFDESVGTAIMPLRVTRPLRKDIMVNFTYEDFIASGKLFVICTYKISL